MQRFLLVGSFVWSGWNVVVLACNLGVVFTGSFSDVYVVLAVALVAYMLFWLVVLAAYVLFRL